MGCHVYHVWILTASLLLAGFVALRRVTGFSVPQLPQLYKGKPNLVPLCGSVGLKLAVQPSSLTEGH